MNKFLILIMIAGIAGGIWNFIKSEKQAIDEKLATPPTMRAEHLEKIKAQQELLTRQQQAIEMQVEQSEQLMAEKQRRISKEAQRENDLIEDRMIHRMKGPGGTSIDACYDYHSRYKTDVEEMRDCIARQSKYGSSGQK